MNRDYLLAEPFIAHPSIREIQREVCAKHGITLHDLLSDRRQKHIVIARLEGYWRAYRETPRSLPTIGRAFRRHHTSVLSGIRAHEARMK